MRARSRRRAGTCRRCSKGTAKMCAKRTTGYAETPRRCRLCLCCKRAPVDRRGAGACKAATAAASPVRRTGLRRATRRTLCDSVPCVRVADRRVGAEAAQVPVFSGLVGIEGQRGQGPAGSVTPTSLPCVSAPPPLLVPRSCVLCRESSTKLTVLCACGQFLPRVDAGLLMCRASQLEEKQDEVRQSCTPARRQLPMCALPSAHARAGTDSVGRVLPRDAA